MSSQYHTFSLDGFLLTELDGFGCQWTVEKSSGWFSGSSVRTNREARSGQSGDRSNPPFRGGRVVTLRGKVFAPDTAALEQAARRLGALFSDGAPGELVGASEVGELWSRVSLEDEPLFEPLSANYAGWQLTVASDDPLLYGLESIASATLDATTGGAGRVWARVWPRDWGVAPGVTPGAATVPNVGTASYHPRLRIDGPVTNPVVRLEESGASLRYNGTIPADTWLDIDCAERVVLLRGQVGHRHLVSFVGDWLSVPPGGGTFSWSADSFGAGHQLTIFGTEGAWA